MNITNAAILYDESFVMDHKYKALLQNIPTRHVITAIGNDRDRAEQIEKLRNLDINNFFILGSFSSIKKVLGKLLKHFQYDSTASTTQIRGKLFCATTFLKFLKIMIASYRPYWEKA